MKTVTRNQIFKTPLGELVKASILANPEAEFLTPENCLALQQFCTLMQWDMSQLTCAYALLFSLKISDENLSRINICACCCDVCEAAGQDHDKHCYKKGVCFDK